MGDKVPVHDKSRADDKVLVHDKPVRADDMVPVHDKPVHDKPAHDKSKVGDKVLVHDKPVHDKMRVDDMVLVHDKRVLVVYKVPVPVYKVRVLRIDWVVRKDLGYINGVFVHKYLKNYRENPGRFRRILSKNLIDY